MLQKKDLDKTLKMWGPIKPSVTKEAIKLWGKIEAESVINLYRMLSKGLMTVEMITIKFKDKNEMPAH